ncbi:MAG: patatin family protein [Velocimicrobium sp.]
MPSLILEGGTFRPIFSCGVMDALLEEDVMFPYIIGVSAGISDGISYVSKQIGRNMEIGKKYRNDKRYIGLGNYRSQKSIFGLDFVFGEIPKKLVPFDWDTYLKYEGKVLVGVTNALTGEAEYIDGIQFDPKFTMFRATCALPVLFPAIELGGNHYYDGGVADPIPVRKAIMDGNKKHLIVLTRPDGYQKTLKRENRLAANRIGKKYPKIKEKMLTRHISYNETVEYCETIQKEGNALIIRPEYPINSFEKDVNTLEKTYQHGYDLAKSQIKEIKALFL